MSLTIEQLGKVLEGCKEKAAKSKSDIPIQELIQALERVRLCKQAPGLATPPKEKEPPKEAQPKDEEPEEEEEPQEEEAPQPKKRERKQKEAVPDEERCKFLNRKLARCSAKVVEGTDRCASHEDSKGFAPCSRCGGSRMIIDDGRTTCCKCLKMEVTAQGKRAMRKSTAPAPAAPPAST